MRFKEYTKGKHIYRRQGKALEVEKINEPRFDADIDSVEREIYATGGQISFNKDRFVLEFTNPSGKNVFKTVMHYQSLKRLSADLSYAISKSEH
jgi:hypothetical protein